MKDVQEELLEKLRRELIRLELSPRLIAYNPAPDCPFGEFELAIDVSDLSKCSGYREVVPLGSYWLAPAVLKRLKMIYDPFGFSISQLLYVLQDFSPDQNPMNFLEEELADASDPDPTD